jgi:cyclase
MLKKRLIFTLLYDQGNFVLSRNFRLQKVGNIEWLRDNYNFSKIAFYIDELIVLDVTRGKKNLESLVKILQMELWYWILKR